MKSRLFPVSCFALLALAMGCTAKSNSKSPVSVFHQNADVLNEVSGVAVVRAKPSFLWMHNDSGDSPRLFAVNKEGKIALTVNLKGATAFDWEDMAAEKEWVYTGDIGDNFSIRSDIQVYRFKSPSVPSKALNQVLNLDTGEWQKTTLRYPDGAHNCESLAVTPDGRMLFVTKDNGGTSGFYVWDKPWKGGSTVTLTKIGSWTFGPADKRQSWTTGADFSPNGRKLVVTTYTDLYEFPLQKPFKFGTLQFKPQKQPLPEQKQCEAVCYSLDGRTIYSTGEGEKAVVWTLPSKLK